MSSSELQNSSPDGGPVISVYSPKQTVLQETENIALLCTLAGEKMLL